MTDTQIIDAITTRRKELKLTQEELALRAGLTRQYIGLVEKHQKTPSVKVLVALCDALGLVVNMEEQS